MFFPSYFSLAINPYFPPNGVAESRLLLKNLNTTSSVNIIFGLLWYKIVKKISINRITMSINICVLFCVHKRTCVCEFCPCEHIYKWRLSHKFTKNELHILSIRAPYGSPISLLCDFGIQNGTEIDMTAHLLVPDEDWVPWAAGGNRIVFGWWMISGMNAAASHKDYNFFECTGHHCPWVGFFRQLCGFLVCWKWIVGGRHGDEFVSKQRPHFWTLYRAPISKHFGYKTLQNTCLKKNKLHYTTPHNKTLDFDAFVSNQCCHLRETDVWLWIPKYFFFAR